MPTPISEAAAAALAADPSQPPPAVPPSSPPAVKPGYLCSEFWVSNFATLFFALVGAGVFPDTGTEAKIASCIGIILAQLGYTASRTITKAKAA